MQAVLLLCFVGAVAPSCMAAPGGYTGIGGVYKNMNQKADYMAHAMKASQMALNLFEDESLSTGEEDRRVRQVYVPSFFTNQPQPVAAEHARPGRDASASQYYDLPLYYQEYSAKGSTSSK